MADTLKLTPTESITIKRSTAEVLEVEVAYGPGGHPPPKHFHPHQDEHFEVLEGEPRVRIGDEERALREGDTIDIPSGAVHQMWNPGDTPARMLWQTRPAGRTEQWFRAIDSLHRDGAPSPGALGDYLTEYSDVFRLAV